jgi:O-methyltransferase involved in polyketide biosynthesis
MASKATDLRTDIPHAARIYDYLLGGKDNFAPDRQAADRITAKMPHLPVSMRASRRFNARMVHYLAAERGIRQFVDIGTGLPTSPNTHEVAQAVAPEARIVYVDNDPLVLVHARALLTSTPEGRTAYIDADLRDPVTIMQSRELHTTLDLSQPVAVTVMAVLQYIEDDDVARGILNHLMDPLPAGSTIALSTVTADTAPTRVDEGSEAYKESGIPIRSRTRAEVEQLFKGYELLEPGVQLVHHWRPDEEARAVPDEHVYMYGAVAVKP